MLKFKTFKNIAVVDLDSLSVDELTIPYGENLILHHTPVTSKTDFGILNEAKYPYEIKDINGYTIKLPKTYDRNPLKSYNGLWVAKPLIKEQPTHKLVIVYGEFRFTGATRRTWTLTKVNGVEIPYIDEFGLSDEIPAIPGVWLKTYQVRNWKRYYAFFLDTSKNHNIEFYYKRHTGRGNRYNDTITLNVSGDVVELIS